MVDRISVEARSRLMGRIRGKDTKPELKLRRALHGLGYRYRLHRKLLPGCPDIVFGGRKKAIWVHGCFWHWHPDEACPIAKVPKSRIDFWLAKLKRNRARDVRTQMEVEQLGWETLTVWECQLRPGRFASTLQGVTRFLDRCEGQNEIRN